MTVHLIEKLLPLFSLIMLGFVFAKLTKLDYSGISKLLMYLINPFLMFYAGLSSKISLSLILLPSTLFIASSLACLFAYALGKFIYGSGSDKNLLAYTAGASNTGYFGLPLVAAVLGDEYFNTAIITGIGCIVFEFTLGFYMAAKGQHSGKDAIIRLSKLPHLYAFSTGLILNIFQIHTPSIISANFEYFKGSYTLLGMMMIGFGLSSLQVKSFDLKFIFINFAIKTLLIPFLVGILILLQIHFGFRDSDQNNYHTLLLLALTPVAANSVNFAQELNLNVGKAALAVLATTVLAMVSIPLVSSFILTYTQP